MSAPAPPAEEAVICQALQELVTAFPRYGYRCMTTALQRMGYQANHKRLHSSLGYQPPAEFEAQFVVLS